MVERIISKLTSEEIDKFISENEQGNARIGYIKTLKEIQQSRIKEYLNNNREQFIEINSKEQFIDILSKKVQFDEYHPDELFRLIFKFPFYVTHSLKLRVGGSISNYGYDFSDFYCKNLELKRENKVIESLFRKKQKVLIGVTTSHEVNFDVLSNDDIKIFKDLINIETEIFNQLNLEIKQESKEKVQEWIPLLDKNGDGEIDLLANDFEKLLTKNQTRVIAFDKSLIHPLIKISNYIKTKKENIQKVFLKIQEIENPMEIENLVGLLKNQIFTYNLLLFNSISMLSSLVEENLIVFYEIYETFDKLGIFNSNWENQISEKLNVIVDKLDDLLFSISEMEQKIVNEISNLTFITQESLYSLENAVSKQLEEVDSSIKFNNLLTGIQTYQLYKINKNTKFLGNR